jgi:hypothetical protein
VPEFWLLTVEGLHVPIIPFVDVVGNAGTVPPAQIDKVVPKPKLGVIFGSIVTVNDVVVAHSPAVGVNVYVPEFRLSTADGLQVPVIPLDDVVGNVGTDAPEQ